MFSANFGNLLNCKPEYDGGKDLLTVQVKIGIFQFGFLLVSRLSQSSLLANGPSQSSHYWSTDFLNPPTSQIVNCPIIRGDTRVLFQSSSDQVFFKFYGTVISSPTNGIFGKLWFRTSCFVILFGKTC